MYEEKGCKEQHKKASKKTEQIKILHTCRETQHKQRPVIKVKMDERKLGA